MLEFMCFGSGSSGNSYYLSGKNNAVIIDAGIGIRTMKKYFLNYDIDTSRINGILITHDHADHIATAGLLSTYLNVNLYVSPYVYNKLKCCALRYKVDIKRLMVVDADSAFQLGDFIINPFRIPHDATDNYGYSIQYENDVFTLMTDIGRPTSKIEYYIKKSNYLVIEADYDPEMLAINPRYDKMLKNRIVGGLGHLSNYQVSDLLLSNYHEKLNFIALCHLSQENNKPDIAFNIVKTKLEEHKLIEGVDYKLEVLKRKHVSGPWTLFRPV